MKEPLNITIDWKEKMQFIATDEKSDYKVAIDIPYVDEGGENKGTTPKYLFLQAMAGCTGQIVVMFLRKMRAEMPSKFSIDVSAKLSSEHPMYFENVDMTYRIEGKTDVEKLKKVIKMSEEQYCGLTFTVAKLAKMNTKVIFNGEEIKL